MSCEYSQLVAWQFSLPAPLFWFFEEKNKIKIISLNCWAINTSNKRKRRGEKEKSPDQKNQKKAKRENSQSKEWEKTKRKKIPDQTLEEKEMCRKVFGPDNIWTNTELSPSKTRKERKPRSKVVLPFWLPTKILCVGGLFTSH